MITITEKINPLAASYIKDAFGIDDLLQLRDYKTKKEAKEELAKIINYVSTMLDENCVQDVAYDFARFTSDGRKFERGVQCLLDRLALLR